MHNKVSLLRISNICRMYNPEGKQSWTLAASVDQLSLYHLHTIDEDADDEDDEDDAEKEPRLAFQSVRHRGTVNRLRVRSAPFE